MDNTGVMGRYAEIARLLWKYRNAGVLSMQQPDDRGHGRCGDRSIQTGR